MQADILIFHHDAAGFQPVLDVERLRDILCWGGQPRAQFGLFAVRREGDAIHRADIDAGVTFDAELGLENGLHVAIQATLRFQHGLAPIKTEFNLDFDVLQRDGFVLVRDLETQVRRDIVVITPFVDAHFLADQIGHRR